MLQAEVYVERAPRAAVELANEAAANSASVDPTGSSVAMQAVRELIAQVAGFTSNVLILGESGTGKEVAARAIHAASPRRQRAFVAVNCGAIPADLLESELFGHEKGAFTGALSARKGRFELAEGGTIFLDEIGDMNPAMQVKLLRVLQERTFERVGSCQTQRCDVRVIAATHRDLEQSIAQGTFREDLYYRLNVVPLEMPPLRERGADLPELIAALNQRIASQHGRSIKLSVAAMAALQACRWPGNVRELANLLERLAIQCGDRLVGVAQLPARYRPSDWQQAAGESELPFQLIESTQGKHVLPIARAAADEHNLAMTPKSRSHSTGAEDYAVSDRAARAELLEDQPVHAEPVLDPVIAEALVQLPESGMDMRRYLEELEQRLITKALEASGGTVAQAARLLGLRRTTLAEKLRKYGIVATDTVRAGALAALLIACSHFDSVFRATHSLSTI